MNELNVLVEQFFLNYPEAKEDGCIIELDEFKGLPKKLRKRIPDWYKALLSAYPLAGIEIGIPHDFGQEALKGKSPEKLPLMEITINDVDELEEYSIESFPGYELIKDRYICFARDEFSTGEGIFFKGYEKNPATHLVFHDQGDANKALIQNATTLTASFTDLFRYGKVSNFNRKLPEALVESAMHTTPIAVASITEFLQKSIDSANEEDVRKIGEMIQKSADHLDKKEPSQSIQAITDTIHELQMSIPIKLYKLAVEAYESCGLHVGELCYMEDLKVE